MGVFDFLFGAKKRQVYLFLKNGALILDVRTKKEYDAGAIKDSMHIPLNDLPKNLESIKKLNKPFVVCCESGVRSAKAVKLLTQNNIDAANGGGWLSLSKKL